MGFTLHCFSNTLQRWVGVCFEQRFVCAKRASQFVAVNASKAETSRKHCMERAGDSDRASENGL